MPQLNDEQLASFKVLTGIDPSQINDVVSAYLKSVSGSTSNDPQDLWYATLTGLGYTGAVQDMQVAYWSDILGYSGQWNDLYFDWLIATGGAFGPNVLIVLASGGSCTFEPPTTTDCTAVGTYTANDSGFTNPANTWLWTIEPPVIGVDLTDATLKTCTVTTPTSGVDLTFNLKVVATDSVSTDTANRTTGFTQDHADGNVTPAYIGPNINNREYEINVLITPVETFNLFVGTNLVFTLEGTWPTGLVIGSASGQITGTPTGALQPYPNLFVRVTNSKGIADSALLQITLVSNIVAPIFDNGPVPAQVWQIDTPIVQFPIGQYFVVGTFPRTYTIESGALPTGLTMNAAGQINGTPTVGGETGSLVVRCTNSAGFALTNNWGWTAWEAIQTTTIPAQTFILNTPYSHDFSQYFTGTISEYSINLLVWPPGFSFDTNTGIVTGTAITTAPYSGLFIWADSLYEPIVQSNSFNGTAGVAPVFSGTIPDQTWNNGDPVSLDTSTYFGGATDATYALATGSLPTSVTLNTSTGLISGTPLVDSNATFSVSCTNALAADTSNVVTWAVALAPTGPAFLALTYDPDAIATVGSAYEMKGVVTGTGGLTATHTAVLYAPDFEGVYRDFAAGAGANGPVWSGGRVVTNLLPDSSTGSVGTPLNGASWTTGISDPFGGTKASRLTIVGNVGSAWTAPGAVFVTGQQIRVSVWIRLNSGTKGAISLYSGSGSSDTTIEAYITSSWQRISIGPTAGVPSSLRFGFEWGAQTATFDIYGLQYEVVGSNTNPSEYVETSGAAVTKTFASTNGNTVTSNVVTEAVGTPLAEMPKLRSSAAVTNSTTYSRDLTNVVWTPTNMTVSKTSSGLTGEPNSACFLTATAGNATILHSAYTSASASHINVMWARRVTGTGAIELTVDGGTTWTAVTVTDTTNFTFVFEGQTVTDPVVGIRIVTSGDAIEIGNVQSQRFGNIVYHKQSGPVFTTTAAASIDYPSYSFDIANLNLTESVWYCEPSGVESVGDSVTAVYMGVSDTATGAIAANGTLMQFGQGSSVHCSHRLGPSDVICTGRIDATENAPWKQASIYSLVAGLTTGNKDGTYWDTATFPASAEIAFTTVYNGSYLRVGNNASNCFTVGNIQRSDITSYAEGKTIIDGLMA